MNTFNEELAKTFLVRFSSPDHLRKWVGNFLDLWFPDSFVDPESNSSPIHWMYEVYKMYEKNEANLSPEVLVISSRSSYKTLSEAVFAIIAMLHFKATVAHMAAIVPQASAAQNYIERFLLKLKPYLDYYNIKLHSQNSREVSLEHPDGSKAGLKIIVCTVTGANSSHTNIFTIDEVDTIRSAEGLRAYKEAKFIPDTFNGQFPVTIKTSTLKFAGGLFSQEWDAAIKKNYKVFKWNILDITEYCPPERHRPDLPKETRYISKHLPLSTLTPEEFESLTDREKERYEPIEAMGGCAKCPLLPVCKGNLSKRSPKDKGGLWKTIDFTISQFTKSDEDPDIAESQLLCKRPQSQGLVYPRFLDSADGNGNVYTIEQAFERYLGFKPNKDVNLTKLVSILKENGIKFYAGVDWGYRHAFALVVGALLPSHEFWLIDAYSIPKLEFDEMLSLAKEVRDNYKPLKWFADTAEPMFIRSFNKNKMPCAEFKKDVRGGIEAIRGQIVNAAGIRRLKVIRHDRTQILIDMFKNHAFKLDSVGNLTQEPDDGIYADIADALRYMGQNLFTAKGEVLITDIKKLETLDAPKPVDLERPLAPLIENMANNSVSLRGKSGSVLWDFGGDDET
jgi:hypothetical protein